MDIINRGLQNYAPGHSYDLAKWNQLSLISKLNRVKRLDWREASAEIARENIGGGIRAGVEYGLVGLGLYSGNIAKVAPTGSRN